MGVLEFQTFQLAYTPLAKKDFVVIILTVILWRFEKQLNNLREFKNEAERFVCQNIGNNRIKNQLLKKLYGRHKIIF
ncbi:hypothetical protein CLV48_101244 [Cecembia rubra]|uniref:Uncharacterized protein n=1 Tax=Cecembia rubra TaxID=1485585 RepID=A0A2P8ECZ4_9BACT|nr:hypothetical protein CLV48_101244 [Cecembia rubra]